MTPTQHTQEATMTNQGYNGWKNYQTWNVALWFGNDEGLYLAVKEYPKRFNKDTVRDFVTELLPDGTPDLKDTPKWKSPYAGVNWQEISRAFNEMRGE
jgi:hypothetical protein